MLEVKKTTKLGESIIADAIRTGHGDIYEAYAHPSSNKIRSYKAIEARAKATPGYNNDLHVTAASSHFYSTAYTYTDDNGNTYAVKDTKSNTYIVLVTGNKPE